MPSEPHITYLTPPSWVAKDGIQQIIRAFERAEQPFRFVGGAVRDTIRGVPVHDIDACTPATPSEVVQLLEAADIRTVPIGLDHGTVLAIAKDAQIEITTLRVDDATDGRHAEVRFTHNLEGDALRRDFTMNALMLASDGTLTDYVGGMADVTSGIVRFIGDPAKRIAEDYLRILRYIRFIATIGSTHIDVDALTACKAAIQNLTTLSAERIQQEMMKLLAADDPRYSLSLLEDMGAAPILFHTTSLKAPHSKHTHALLRLSLILRTQKVAPSKIALGWRLSKADSQLLTTLVRAPALPPLHLLQEHGEDAATLIAQRAQAEERYDMDMFKAVRKTWKMAIFPITGQDVMDAGIPAGAEIGKILAKLKNEWKKSDYALTKTALIKILSSIIAATSA